MLSFRAACGLDLEVGWGSGWRTLDRDGRPAFNDLLFGRREPVYIAFDVLFVDGGDVRAVAMKERKALLEKVVRR